MTLFGMPVGVGDINAMFVTAYFVVFMGQFMWMTETRR